ncbi:DNA repair photolyase [Herbaspirillum sp. Sphag1AN]|uniref:PA0069 family radical SAM protein n=1 Tax=unclassified Herbaspirillum TaxID=2624150 RepID=UPI00160AACE4|nr:MULTISPECIES: PA0069 family radical SAM protein [unclassified Herbaspirillum]MBB3211443.1 DNA repair photolyase [Herbaspirillum sp. Sphag1AN]MBB3245290.1 DNA repair photolyase [Herbaspirillum sp. Sphag64]
MGKSSFKRVPLQTARKRESAAEQFSQAYTGIKGRGAVSNMQGRYEVLQRVDFDDGWASAEGADQADHHQQEIDPPPLRTIVTPETARSILSRNTSPDLPFDVSLNPYRGCEHGCVYCFARPTHSYLGLSPGLDFESRIFAKINAPELLLHELSKPGYRPDTITVGINTDAYQPCERELRITRGILQILADCAHPVALITKSSLIERDIDLLAPMAARRQCIAAVTIATLDSALARRLEPRAASPQRRLRVIRTLAAAGIPVSVSIAPVIPFINEPEIEHIIAAAAEAGACRVGYTVLRLPWEVNSLFQQWLQTYFPERAARVMNRLREMRGGKDYDADFATRMRGEGVWADLIRQRVEKAVQRNRLALRGWFDRLDASAFVPPARPAKSANRAQLDLF